MKKETTTERKEALAWFNAKDDLDKGELCFIYYGSICDNNYKFLTSRQIENIWKGETEKIWWKVNNQQCKQKESCYSSISKKCICPKEQPKKENYKYIGECKGNDGNGCFMDACGHDCGCFTRVTTTDSPTLKEIEEQVSITQKRGEKIAQYLKNYEGQIIYNEIALAIEFGYQIKVQEEHGKKLLNFIDELDQESLQLPPKQETLEETAFRLFPRLINDPYNPMEDDNKEYRDIWISGAKWMQERMYSEEEVEHLIYNVCGTVAKLQGIILDGNHIDAAYKQFKNK